MVYHGVLGIDIRCTSMTVNTLSCFECCAAAVRVSRSNDKRSFHVSPSSSGIHTRYKMTYGFVRLEVIGAMVSVMTIWLLTGILVYEGVLRLQRFSANPNRKEVREREVEGERERERELHYIELHYRATLYHSHSA